MAILLRYAALIKKKLNNDPQNKVYFRSPLKVKFRVTIEG